MESTASAVELLLAHLQKSVEVGMTKIHGDLALVLQRLDQSDARHAELVRRVDSERTELMARIDELEDRQRHAETGVVTKEDAAQRWTRVVGVIGLMVTAVGILVAAVIGVIGLIKP